MYCAIETDDFEIAERSAQISAESNTAMSPVLQPNLHKRESNKFELEWVTSRRDTRTTYAWMA
jgi:hypothetical protein